MSGFGLFYSGLPRFLGQIAMNLNLLAGSSYLFSRQYGLMPLSAFSGMVLIPNKTDYYNLKLHIDLFKNAL